jgi:hypothetical protein
MPKDGPVDTGMGSAAPAPSAEIKSLLGLATAPQAQNAEGQGTPSRSEDKAPPVLTGAYRVPLDGGNRHVEITPERVAQLIAESEQRGSLEAAQAALDQKVKQSAVYQALGERLEGMSLEDRQRFMQMAFRQQEQNGHAHEDLEEDPIERVTRIANGTPVPRQQVPPSEIEPLKQAVLRLVEIEQGRQQQQHEQTLEQKVKDQMAQYGVFKSRPDGREPDAPIAGLAKDVILAELARSRNPQADLARIVAAQADRASKIDQRARESTVEEIRQPTASMRGQQPTYSAEDLRRGRVREAAKHDFFAELRRPPA